MKTSNNGIDLIKNFEGFRPDAYLCPANVATIGYGHTRTAAIGLRITEQEAVDLLKSDVVFAEIEVNRHGLSINQNQFDALVSFVFNVGAAAFRNSTLLNKIKTNADEKAVRFEFLRWDKAGGKSLKGLAKRRAAEANLYFSR